MFGVFSDDLLGAKEKNKKLEEEMEAAFQDIQGNPANMAKHQSNPKIAAVIQKLSDSFIKVTDHIR